MNWKVPKIFFGWWIVGALFVMELTLFGEVFLIFTAIFEPLVKEFSWSYTQISLAASLRGMGMGLLVPLTGILVDRFGPRRLIIVGALVNTFGLLFLSRAHSLGAFYAAVAIIAVGNSTCTFTVTMTTLANWFREKLGIASAIALSGYMCGGLIAPFVVRLVDGQGWRSTIDIFAIGMLILVIPLSLLFRHRPEPYGYLPDGRISNDIASSIPEESVSGVKSTTLKQALKKRVFWHISLAFTLLYMAISAFAIHILPYLSSIGIERTTASLYVALLSVPAVAGRLMLGWIIDRYSKRMVTQALFITMGLAMFCFSYAATAGAGVLFVGLILFGASLGGSVPVRASITRELFGRKSFGSIFGMIAGLNLLGLMSGPPLAGWVFDTWYSYNTSWLILAGLSVFGMIVIFTTPRSGVLEPTEEVV